MALSGSFILTRTSGTQYLQGRVEWSATQDAVGNTSTVRARLIFKRTNTGYTTYGTGTFNMTVNGTAFSTGSVSYSFGSSDVVMLDKTVTVPHNSDGSKSFTISADYSGNSPIGGNGSQSFALNTIDRNAPSISLSVGNISSNSFTLSATANYTCDTWQYSINNGSSWVTFSTSSSASVNTTVTGLSPATSYSVIVRGRRSHNHIYGSSPVKTVKTIGNAILNSVGSLLVDSAAPVLRINITTYVAGYTHRLDICNGSTVITSISNIKTSAGTKNIDLALSASNRTAILNSMKTVKSFSATYMLYTYDGSSLIGSVSSKTGAVNTSAENSSPSFSASPAYTFRDSNTTTTGITGNNQLLIQEKSSLFVQVVTAVAKNGASIARYTVTINKKSVSSTTTAISYGGVDISGNVTVTVTATDSRGYTVSASGVITVIPYSDIQITNLSLSRINNYEVNCVLNIAGRFSSITVGGSDKNSLQSLSYRKKQAASQTWSSWTELEPDVTSSGFSYANSEFEDLSRDSAWDFEFKASDILSTNTVSIQVAEGTPTLSLRKNKVGINNHDPQAALDIQGDVVWNGMHFDTAMKKDPGQTGKDTYTLLAQYQVSAANRDFTEVYSATAKYMPYEIYGNNSMLFELSMRTGSSSLSYFNIRYLTPPLRGTQICASIQGSGVNLTIKVYAYCVDMWTEVKFNVISENRNPEHITRVLYTDQEPVSSISGTIVFGEYWGGSLPNLIINSDFAINQRNLETWTPSNVYGVDRWKTTSTASCQRVKNDCPKYFSESNAYYKLRINCKNSAYNSVFQPFENFSQYIGKSMTISFAATCKNSGTVRCGIGNSSFLVPLFAGKWKKVTLYVENITAQSNSDLNGLWLQTENNSSTAGSIGYWEIAGVQICLGKGVGTYVPPNPATELVKCQRFYQTTNNNISQRVLIPVNPSGIAYGFVPFPVTMRTIPRVNYIDISDTTGLAAAANGIDVNKGGLTANQTLGIRYAASAEL